MYTIKRHDDGWFIISDSKLVFTGLNWYPYFSALRFLLNEIGHEEGRGFVANKIEIRRNKINVSL